MKTWIMDFKPKMIMFVHPCLEDETAIMVQAVCADRVLRVRYKIATKNAGGDKKILRWLGVNHR